MAQQQSDQAKKHNLEYNAASEYEIQKKIDKSQRLDQPAKVYIPNKNINQPENMIFNTKINLHINGNVKGSGVVTVSTENDRKFVWRGL